MGVELRTLRAEDHDGIVAMNNAAVPAVSMLETLDFFVDVDATFLVAGPPGAPTAFLIGLTEGIAYPSVNYQWFTRRYDSFLYVDRVVVDPQAQRRGLGRALYDAFIETRCEEMVLLAEVNVRPRNDQSLRFHDLYGFVAVGEQETPGDKRVVMLEKALPNPHG